VFPEGVGAAAPAERPPSDPYAAFVHDLAQWTRARIIARLDESSVLSNRAKLIYGAAWLAGAGSADWYLTAEIASPGDEGGPGIGSLLRWRAEMGTPPTEDDFFFVAVVCTFFHLFAVMADRDRLSTARTFATQIGAPPELGDLAYELEHAYPTRRLSPRQETNLASYLAQADLRLAEHLGVDNSPGLSVEQATTVLQQFNALFRDNVAAVVQRLE